MAHSTTWDEPFLPWVESQNDRRFKKLLFVFLTVSLVLGAIVPFLPTPEPVQKDLKTVSPRLAKLILEKKKQPPPPPPKVEKKEKKKKVEKKKVEKKKTKKQEDAMKKAASTGLVALSDELMDLRESFDFTAADDVPLKKSADIGKETFDRNVITSKATKDSGGIKTNTLTRSTGGSNLASRSTTQVQSTLGTGTSKTVAKRSSSGKLIRPEQEIEQVFQKNKGAIFSIYNRALRKDPTLQGKVILELTIAPDGQVIKCKVLSSELNNPNLERKLIARVKLFRFKPSNVEQIVVKYPIDFLPS